MLFRSTLTVSLSENFAAGKLASFYVFGSAQTNDMKLEAFASTLPAVRKLFPNLVYHPTELDGRICVGVTKPGRKSEGLETKDSTAK